MVPVALDSNAREEKEVRLSVCLSLWSSTRFCISRSTSHSAVVTWSTFFLKLPFEGFTVGSKRQTKEGGGDKRKLYTIFTY